jgi:transcriptional regulator with XRE-family HTH domain
MSIPKFMQKRGNLSYPFQAKNTKEGKNMAEHTQLSFCIDNNDILQRITGLCRERGWSLYKLADEAGIKSSTLTNLYARNNMPTVATIHKLCSAFNISLSQFFQLDGRYDNNLSDDEQILIDTWNQLNSSDRQVVQAYIDGLLKRPR